MRWPKLLIISLAVATMLGAVESPPPHHDTLLTYPAFFSGELSVLTYNVHGLPWPLTWGRPADFLHIADRLEALHGHRPQVVVLQEAFTDEARQIGHQAGYRYVANGPDDEKRNPLQPTAAENRFLSGARWTKGEGLGKFVGSGLQILSDYPIVRTRSVVFPAFACAGYDCLANKGALMATIRLPGAAGEVDIVTTHFNSRGKSGVGDERSDQAYRLQADCLTAFIRDNHDPERPLIVAGDFNIGTSAFRRTALVDRSRPEWVSGAEVRNVYDEAVRERLPLSTDAEASRKKAKDWQFFSSGRQTGIALRRVEVPFGRAADGSMLSDHIGYAAVYALNPARRTL
ncbi:MAG TPA: endonuclease/exonuclease/phosphatase family protein [Sphingobium sp.]|uniref:endonuclease/exonuclease/phosphatase family protein n=1 Tax=Sphingobium sp. TaxID=1912891 RepID=UPI002ED18C71